MKIQTIYKTITLSLLMMIFGAVRVMGYGGNTSYVLNDANERSYTAPNSTKSYTWSGPAKTVTFQAKWAKVKVLVEYGNTANTSLEYSTDGSNWKKAMDINLPSSAGTWGDYSCTLPENATHIRLKSTMGATGYRYIRNVKVTRATNITATTPSINFGTQAVNASSTQSASFSYNNTTYYQQVKGTCPTGFSVTPTDVGATGSSSVKVNYSSSTPGVHSGTITLNMNGASTTLSVSGKTEATYNFSATATPNYSTHGTATASVGQSSITSTNSTVSTSVTYTATANPGYEFVGWGTSADATTYESTNSTYTTTISATFPTTSASETLYAIFAVIRKTLTLDPAVAPNVKYAGTEYSKVTLQRTLKAGYNTIALPFDIDVETLAGSSYDADQDWVAQLSSVTYNAHDGYTLYFKKISDGCIKANQPYILHLSAQVSNPAFSNVIVHSPQSTSIVATKGYNAEQWQMVSNYTPGAAMQGKYGVINSDNCLKIGSATSTINAFGAYINYLGGAAPSMARTAYADDDTTDIGSLDADDDIESDHQAAYDLSGRRISHTSGGIKIVVSPKGKGTKIIR